MSFNLIRWKTKDFLAILIILHLVLYLSILFDLSPARQVIGYIYLTFIPGLVILRMLKLREFDNVEILVFAVGFSIAVLVLVGVLMNETLLLIGYQKPLTIGPELVTITSFIFTGSVLSHFSRKDSDPNIVSGFRFSLKHLLLCFLPVLSVLGAIWANSTGDNSLLILLLLMIAFVFGIIILFSKPKPLCFYSLLVFSISFALLFHSSMISSFIYGADIHLEYYSLKLTQGNGFWNPSGGFGDPSYGRINTMLSVTILPTIYSNILGVEGTWILKIVFPFIFSLVPLLLFKLWDLHFGKKTAIVSVFLFVSQMTFYTEMLGLARQMIAELFFVLLFFVIFSDKLKSIQRFTCFMIFSFALVSSHYAISVIFFFFIFIVWLYLFLTGRKRRVPDISYVVFYFVIMFSWYVYTSQSSSFESILMFGTNVWNNLGDFFDPTSRGEVVLRGLGMGTPGSLLQTVSRMTAYLTQFFILIGFVGLIKDWKNKDLDMKYVIFSSLSMTLLILCIFLPSFASTLNMTRFYHIVLFFLAPFFAIGCMTFVRLIGLHKREIYFSTLVVLIILPYFLFQTGFIYETTGERSWSIPLSSYREKYISYAQGIVDVQDVYGAVWLSESSFIDNAKIYSDDSAKYTVLTSYGMVPRFFTNVISNTTEIEQNGLLFLRFLNTEYQVFFRRRADLSSLQNISQLYPILDVINKVYSNDGCEIYEQPS